MARDLTNEELMQLALSMAPVLTEMLEHVQSRLPPHTHCAILVEAKGGGAATVLAAATDRNVMAFRAAEYAMQVLSPMEEGQ